MTRTIVVTAVLGLTLSLPAARAVAQDAAKPGAPAEPLKILADRPDAAAGSSDLLGPVYESPAQGIVVRGPAGSKTIKSGVAADEIIQFANDDKGWLLKVSRAHLQQPVPLVVTGDGAQKGKKGLLELTREQFKDGNPGTEILREELLRLGSTNAGMLAARYTQNAQRRFMQQAIVRDSDQVYYVLTMTSPGSTTAKAGSDEVDPREKLAADTFQAVVESFNLLDRGKIKEDQDFRLFRTRAFYVNLKPDRIREAVVPEQCLRLLRDGKDIGYTYVVEQVKKHNGVDSLLVGIRSHTEPDANFKIDAESWLISSLDRRSEEWSNGALADAGKGAKEALTEFGTSDQDVKRVLDPNAGVVDKNDPKQPPVRKVESYTLTVNFLSKAAAAEPIKRDLPPWYLPQAVGQLLPRLLPRTEPKTFLFATWSSDQREVIARYVDVGAQTTVKLGDKTVRAIPVKDRLGLEGASTTHYVDPTTGKYLGSISEDSHITILPTDQATLVSIWKTPNLTPPGNNPKPAPVPTK
jgi:hypothetical protein